MAPHHLSSSLLALSFLTVLLCFSIVAPAAIAGRPYHTGGPAEKCSTKDIAVNQKEVSRGLHPRWHLDVRSKCKACEASIVELWCPSWVEGKAIEGYMYPVELVGPGLCMVGAPVTVHTPFSYTYHQPAGKVNLTVASVKYTCEGSGKSYSYKVSP